MTKKYNGKGRVSMGRVSSNIEDDYINIEVVDEKSGTRFLDAKIALNEFANMVTGLHGRPCDITVHSLDRLGKTREIKTEQIVIPDDMPFKADDDIEFIESLMSEYETDGWVGSKNDLFNHHKHEYVDGVLVQNVSFHRYVDDDNAQDD